MTTAAIIETCRESDQDDQAEDVADLYAQLDAEGFDDD